ncbi:MAG TPA: ATP-binding SpoIIE family protein phosphatase [Verrucomicrobiales bacterium]|nr:ATP-binding SpoIIE family protein phosphatase [Verrucomicrobiales bacterium]
MMSSYRMEVSHESHAGQVRRYVQEAAHRLGADDTRTGTAAIVATELATNLVKHGGGGEVLVREVKDSRPPALEIHALDTGPGMSNVNACLRDGYSTAGSAGTGLGAVQRLADQFQIHSQPGRGTVVWVRMDAGARELSQPTPLFEASGVSVAIKSEKLCGDSWDVQELPGLLRAVVVDGLGHGPFAEAASREAVTIFRRHERASPGDLLQRMHEALVKTRGAAASMAEIQHARGQMRTAGVGNVLMRLFRANGSKTVAGDNGTLGAAVRKVQEFSHPWEESALLVMHSDGIASQWNLDDYPGLVRRHPALIAGIIYRDFRRGHDDATVVVIRQLTV